tara:strand:+ start:431 stop:535 length:105 start_codon:yes stop_codon:yes gene_type:complete
MVGNRSCLSALLFCLSVEDMENQPFNVIFKKLYT